MTVQLAWYEEGRVVYQCFSGVLSEDDVWEVADSLEQRAEHGIAPVHTIIDVRHVTDFPVSIDQISRLRSDAQMQGWMVVVGLHPIARFLARLMSQLRGLHYYTATSLEEALNFLVRQDSALVHITALREISS